MDISYLLLLQRLREAMGGAFDSFAVVFSDVGLVVLSVAVPLLVFWCVDKDAGALSLFSMGIGSAGNQLVKNTACVYRPWLRSDELHPVAAALAGATGYSFPSGHTASVASALLGLAWRWRKRVLAVALCVVGVLLMGFSRNFLGVHTPQDVLAGILVGVCAVAVSALVLKWVERGRNRDVVVLAVGLLVIAGLLVYFVNKPYPLDYLDGKLVVDPAKMITDCFTNCGIFAGVLCGWFVERRWVGFSVEGSLLERIVRFVVGAIVVAGIMYGLGGLSVSLLGAWAGKFVLMFCVFFSAVCLYPLLFHWLHLCFAK